MVKSEKGTPFPHKSVLVDNTRKFGGSGIGDWVWAGTLVSVCIISCPLGWKAVMSSSIFGRVGMVDFPLFFNFFRGTKEKTGKREAEFDFYCFSSLFFLERAWKT